MIRAFCDLNINKIIHRYDIYFWFCFVLFRCIFLIKVAHPKVVEDRGQNHLNYSKEKYFCPFPLEIFVPRSA